MKKIRYIFIFFSTILIGILFFENFSKAQNYTEPYLKAPRGNISRPLDASAISQTKAGNLILEGLQFYIKDAGYVPPACPDAANEGKAYYDGSDIIFCTNVGWETLTSGAVGNWVKKNIFMGAEGNQVYLKARASTDNYAFKGISDLPAGGTWRAGLYGTTRDSAYQTSAVAGVATADNNQAIGVYGSAQDFENAWAGYFYGHVRIEKSEGGATKLMLGEVGSPVDLCLNGVCKDTWPGSGFWQSSGTDIYKASQGRDVVIGGTNTSEAIFYFRNDANMSLVIGKPTGFTSSLTCGDRVCNSNENSIQGDANYCGQDCKPVISNETVLHFPPSAIINWDVSEFITDGFVRYGLDTNYSHSDSPTASTTGLGTLAVLLTNLTPSTEYHYQIVSTDSYGNTTISQDLTFTTP